MDNTHYYDGKLDFASLYFPPVYKQALIDKFVTDIKPENLENYHTILEQLHVISVEEIFPIVRRVIVLNLINILKDKITPKAFIYLHGIIKDYGTSKNYDPTNKLSADDLLYLTSYHLHDETFIILLIEQLENMEAGFCEQGRTHRLFQLILAFQEEVTSTLR